MGINGKREGGVYGVGVTVLTLVRVGTAEEH
jgi:hypothetical protein